MARKTPEMQIEKAKRDMKVAHEKKLDTIDEVAKRAKDVETATYEKKIRMLDMAALKVQAAARQASATSSKISARAATVADAAGGLASSVADTAGELASTVGGAASDASEAVGAEAAKLGTKASRGIRRSPWIVAIAAAGVVFALGISVGRRYFGQPSAA